MIAVVETVAILVDYVETIALAFDGTYFKNIPIWQFILPSTSASVSQEDGNIVIEELKLRILLASILLLHLGLSPVVE